MKNLTKNKEIVIGFNFSPYKLMLGACDMNGKIVYQKQFAQTETLFLDRTYTYHKQKLSFKENFENFLQKGNLNMSQIVCLGINKDNLLENQILGFNLINRLSQKINKPLFLVGNLFAMNNLSKLYFQDKDEPYVSVILNPLINKIIYNRENNRPEIVSEETKIPLVDFFNEIEKVLLFIKMNYNNVVLSDIDKIIVKDYEEIQRKLNKYCMQTSIKLFEDLYILSKNFKDGNKKNLMILSNYNFKFNFYFLLQQFKSQIYDNPKANKLILKKGLKLKEILFAVNDLTNGFVTIINHQIYNLFKYSSKHLTNKISSIYLLGEYTQFSLLITELKEISTQFNIQFHNLSYHHTNTYEIPSIAYETYRMYKEYQTIPDQYMILTKPSFNLRFDCDKRKII